jgi:type VI secretion system protein ImpF
MARREEPSVQPSLIDRLIDRDPASPVDPQYSRSQSAKSHKDAVRRDLEWLLNTRRIVDPAPEAFAETCGSLYHYGMPDITSLSVDAPDTPLRLMRQLEQAIELFEPRLSGVRITPIETEDSEARHVRFLIEALLEMEPEPEQVAFDTVLEISSGKFQVDA